MDACTLVPLLDGEGPLYSQLYRWLAGAIRAGDISPGQRLPSKRRLCQLLGMSMSTVESAYSLLVAEGYVVSRPRSGFVSAPILPMDGTFPPAFPSTPEESAPSDASLWRWQFSTGAVDTSVFPFSSWARLTKEAVYEHPDLLQRGHSQGDLPLRESLCSLLAQYRGVRCHPDQLLVGAGVDYLLSILLQLLPEHDTVGLEDPGYPAAYDTVRHLGRRAVSLPLDEEGLIPEALEASGVGLAYVTPSHQFPMGMTMPIGRRSRLLRWAGERVGRYLIEDDYDSEFRYTSRPIPALQGLDTGGRVIYLGTFSRSIAPSIRIAYLILPPSLLTRYRQMFPRSACTVSRFEQETLRRLLDSGLYGRHLRRAGNLYRKKCFLLTQALSSIPHAHLSGHGAGLHFLLTVSSYSEEELVARAHAHGIRVHALSQYCHTVAPIPSTLVIGYAGLTLEEIPQAAAALCLACSIHVSDHP